MRYHTFAARLCQRGFPTQSTLVSSSAGAAFVGKHLSPSNREFQSGQRMRAHGRKRRLFVPAHGLYSLIHNTNAPPTHRCWDWRAAAAAVGSSHLWNAQAQSQKHSDSARRVEASFHSFPGMGCVSRGWSVAIRVCGGERLYTSLCVLKPWTLDRVSRHRVSSACTRCQSQHAQPGSRAHQACVCES